MSDEEREELDGLQATFDLRWKADVRAIKMWREANPGNDLVMPDHADLVCWLLDERDALLSAIIKAGLQVMVNDDGVYLAPPLPEI